MHNRYTVKFPEKIWDRAVLRKLLKLKKHLVSETNHSNIWLDFTETSWSEPTSLLFLVTLLQNFKHKIETIILDFGDISGFHRRNFLRFLARQQFLAAFPNKSEFHFIDINGYQKETFDLEEISGVFLNLSGNAVFRGQDCIFAEVVKTNDLKKNKHEAFIERLISEAASRSKSYSFNLTEYDKEKFFQRLRKFLFEATLNCVEHAYNNVKSSHVSVFARIRQGVPKSISRAQNWHQYYNEEKQNALTIKGAHINIHAEWIEVFVCDAGDGILAHAKDWKPPNITHAVSKKITKYLLGKEPLANVARLLFREPLSRFGNRESYRTNITGLMEIARTLTDGSGYLRIIDGAEGVGGQFPWGFPNQGLNEIIATTKTLESRMAVGTCLALSIQQQSEGQAARHDFFQKPTIDDTEAILGAFRHDAPVKENILCFDRRFLEVLRPNPDEIEIIHNLVLKTNHVSVFVRLPKRATKQDIARWIYELNWQSKTANSKIEFEISLIFVDFNGYQAELFPEFISGPVAELCRSFNRVLYAKGERLWERNVQQNLDRKQSGWL